MKDINNYYQEIFLPSLKSKKRKQNLELITDLGALYGVEHFSKDLEYLLQVYEAYEQDENAFYSFFIDLEIFHKWTKQKENRFESILSQEFTQVAAFSNTIYLASDGGSGLYFVSIGVDSKVYYYDRGSGEFSLMAESLPVFAYLLHIWKKANDIEESYEEVDLEEMFDDKENYPELVEIESMCNQLNNKINTYESDFELLTDYCPIEMLKSDDLVENFEMMYIIKATFGTNGPYIKSTDKPTQKSLKELESKIQIQNLSYYEKMYWMWSLFIFEENKELKNLCAYCLEDPVILIQDCAKLMKILQDKNQRVDLDYLRALHYFKGDFSLAMPEGKIWEALLKIEEGNDALFPNSTVTVKQVQENLLKNPKEHRNWDAMAYYYYLQKDWGKMLVCVDCSISIEPFTYYVWLQKGIAMSQIKQYEEALKAYNISLMFERNTEMSLSICLNKIEMYIRLQEPEKARFQFVYCSKISADKTLEHYKSDEDMQEFFVEDSGIQKLVK